jgi:hypothetical protein
MASRNASVVKVDNTTSELVRLENKNIFFFNEKRSRLIHRWR